MKKVNVVLKNEYGLHARPANVFTKMASKIKSELKVYKNNDESKTYDPKSIISVLSMGAVKGDQLTIIAEGIDEEEAISNLKNLIENELVG